MRYLKGLLVGMLALMMLTMLAIYLTPLDAYVPTVEQTLSVQLHQPVSIRKINLEVFPLPHLELQGVRLGGKEAIVARAVDVEPDVPGLLERRMIVRKIVVHDGTAQLEPLRKLVESFANPPATMQRASVREVQLSGMVLSTPRMTLGPIEGKLEFGQAGSFQRAWFAMDKQKTTLIVQALPQRYFSVRVLAYAWTLPQLPEWPLERLQVEGVLRDRTFTASEFSAVTRGISLEGSGKAEFSDGWKIKARLTRIDTTLEQVMSLSGKKFELTGALSAKGLLSAKAGTLKGLRENFQFDGEAHASRVTLRIAPDFAQPVALDEIRANVDAEPDRLLLSALKARLYGGRLSGEASLDRKKGTLDADLAASGIGLRHLVEALTNEVLLTGTLDSAARLSMHLGGGDEFPANARIAGSFHLRSGSLTKVDLLQVANNPGAISSRSGTTRFDDLSGLFKVDEAGYHFRRVKISSGSLNAEGKADISPSLQLSGRLEADVRGTAGLVSMPMNISGTLSDPVVRPSGSALAGAAVGTAFLGPGLGTAVGIKVGSFLTRLVGKDGDKAGTNPASAPVKR